MSRSFLVYNFLWMYLSMLILYLVLIKSFTSPQYSAVIGTENYWLKESNVEHNLPQLERIANKVFTLPLITICRMLTYIGLVIY
jgi:hypothetical protein